MRRLSSIEHLDIVDGVLVLFAAVAVIAGRRMFRAAVRCPARAGIAAAAAGAGLDFQVAIGARSVCVIVFASIVFEAVLRLLLLRALVDIAAVGAVVTAVVRIVLDGSAAVIVVDVRVAAPTPAVAATRFLAPTISIPIRRRHQAAQARGHHLVHRIRLARGRTQRPRPVLVLVPRQGEWVWNRLVV